MTQAELTRLNLGRSLDSLMNLDPRGYGVSAILYDESRRLAGGPLAMHAAGLLLKGLKAGDTVYFITGFVLRPYNKQETDGPLGAAALARTLVKALGVKPVFVVPGEAVSAMERCAAVMGYDAAVVEFTKDAAAASAQAERVVSLAGTEGAFPSFCVAVEAAGANKLGVYHNALGFDVTPLEAKSDVLFRLLQNKGVPTLAIGDLGNECGMGTLGDHLRRFIPRAAEGSCACGCGGGLAAATAADTVVSATVSNWGAWGIASALAYLTRSPGALYSPGLEEKALAAANECGLIDMDGEAVPAVDGMNLTKLKAVITLMNECVISALELEETCRPWFEKTLALGYFDSPGGMPGR
ncbi:MAG: DUF4392 domain-containing protein [Spirochaetaceae bacterium]|jgi:hypothetical protein|nr:DUF4392 domain-containing protein [Spirochaetaceae bacterium]